MLARFSQNTLKSHTTRVGTLLKQGIPALHSIGEVARDRNLSTSLARQPFCARKEPISKQTPFKSFLAKTGARRSYSESGVLILNKPWTQKQNETCDTMAKDMAGAMSGGGPIILSLDFDGTLAHTKRALKIAIERTVSKFIGRDYKLDPENENEGDDKAIKLLHGRPEEVFEDVCNKINRIRQQGGLDPKDNPKPQEVHKEYLKHLAEVYPVTAERMPGSELFLKIASKLQKLGLIKLAIVSHMEHDILNITVKKLFGDNPDIDIQAIEGKKGEDDKETIGMFPKRVYPKLLKDGEKPLAVWCKGDSRSSDDNHAKTAPGGNGRYISYCGPSETHRLHANNWFQFAEMTVESVSKAIKAVGSDNILSAQQVKSLKADLMASNKEIDAAKEQLLKDRPSRVREHKGEHKGMARGGF